MAENEIDDEIENLPVPPEVKAALALAVSRLQEEIPEILITSFVEAFEYAARAEKRLARGKP